MDILASSFSSSFSASASSSSSSSCTGSSDDRDSNDASGPMPVVTLLPRQKRRQFFEEPRVCANCRFQFVRSAQYSGHLKYCRPNKPWNGVPTRSLKRRRANVSATAVAARGTVDTRVTKATPKHGRKMGQKAPRMLPSRSPEIVSSSPSGSSDESETVKTAWTMATTMGETETPEQSFVAFVRQHMAMLSPCTTRGQLETVDAHLQRRIEALQRMRTVAHAGIRRFQIAEAVVSESIDAANGSLDVEHDALGRRDTYH